MPGPAVRATVDGGRSYETALSGNATGKDGGVHAQQASKRQEREAVRGVEGEGHVEGARRQDRELARLLVARRQEVGSGGDSRQGGTTAQKKAAGRKGGKAAAKKS